MQTKTSTPIFVDAVSKDKRKVYLEIRSGVMEFDRRAFGNYVKEQFINNDNGYTLAENPEDAQYLMNIFVLNLEKTTPKKADAALAKGFIGGGAVGGIGALALGGDARTSAGVGLAAGLAGAAANIFVTDVLYMLVADVQVKENTNAKVIQSQSMQAQTSDKGSMSQRVSEVVDKKEYRTRIVTTANKANLELAEAQELMFQKTAYAMAGFF